MNTSLPGNGQAIAHAEHRGLFDLPSHSLVTETGRVFLPQRFEWQPSILQEQPHLAFDTARLIHLYPFGGGQAATIFRLDSQGEWAAQNETFTVHTRAHLVLREAAAKDYLEQLERGA